MLWEVLPKYLFVYAFPFEGNGNLLLSSYADSSVFEDFVYAFPFEGNGNVYTNLAILYLQNALYMPSRLKGMETQRNQRLGFRFRRLCICFPV